MRITDFSATNFMTHTTRNVEFDQSVNLILVASGNGKGKTAMAQGIELAMTGNLVRGIAYKKDLQELITQGENAGSIVVGAIVDGEQGVWKVNLRTGAQSGGLLDGQDHSLNPRAFLALDGQTRRKILFRLTGIQPKPAEVKDKLIAQGHVEARIDKVFHHIRLGFEGAAVEAKSLASEARGAWKSLTGETHGTEKGSVWVSVKPRTEKFDPIDQLQERANAAQTSVDARKQERDQIKLAAKTWAKVADSRAAVAASAEAKKLLDPARAEMERLQGEQARLKAATPVEGKTVQCPACSIMLWQDKAGGLSLRSDAHTHQQTPAAARADLAAADKALRDAMAKVNDLRDQIAAGDGAQSVLSNLPPEPEDGLLEDSEAETAAAETVLALAKKELQDATSAAAAASEADAITARARGYHEDVIGFERLSDALHALPAQYTAETLAKLNALCAQASGALEKPVVFGEDMEPRYGTIRYGMASRSQQWSIEMVVGYAMAVMGGLRVLLVDEFDLLELRLRNPVLRWLSSQDQVQAMLFATLKEKPTLPASIQVVWL